MQIIILDDVKHFILGLEAKYQGRVSKCIDLLRNNGHLLRMPNSRYIAPGIFELRITGSLNIRLIYSFTGVGGCHP